MLTTLTLVFKYLEMRRFKELSLSCDGFTNKTVTPVHYVKLYHQWSALISHVHLERLRDGSAQKKKADLQHSQGQCKATISVIERALKMYDGCKRAHGYYFSWHPWSIPACGPWQQRNFHNNSWKYSKPFLQNWPILYKHSVDTMEKKEEFLLDPRGPFIMLYELSCCFGGEWVVNWSCVGSQSAPINSQQCAINWFMDDLKFTPLWGCCQQHCFNAGTSLGKMPYWPSKVSFITFQSFNTKKFVYPTELEDWGCHFHLSRGHVRLGRNPSDHC